VWGGKLGGNGVVWGGNKPSGNGVVWGGNKLSGSSVDGETAADSDTFVTYGPVE
jgi:hypothetical protein